MVNKLKRNQISQNSFGAKIVEERANGIHYGMRVEFRDDSDLIFGLLRPWVLSWQEASTWEFDDSHVDDKGLYWTSRTWGADSNIEFIVRKDGPALNELRWLINTLVDRHVPAQTVAPIDTFTGERIGGDVLDEIAVPPNADVVNAAINSLKRLSESFKIVLDSSLETTERLQAQLGDEEPYKRRIAHRQARFWLEHLAEKRDGIDLKRVEETFYKNMTVDKAGAHIVFPG